MKRNFISCCAILFCAAPASTFAPASVALVNGTGSQLRSMELRLAPDGAWGDGPLVSSEGARTSWTFDDSVCGYDFRATTVSGDSIVFKGVNPCDARTLTLRRNAGVGWVDYD